MVRLAGFVLEHLENPDPESSLHACKRCMRQAAKLIVLCLHDSFPFPARILTREEIKLSPTWTQKTHKKVVLPWPPPPAAIPAAFYRDCR